VSLAPVPELVRCGTDLHAVADRADGNVAAHWQPREPWGLGRDLGYRRFPIPEQETTLVVRHRTCSSVVQSSDEINDHGGCFSRVGSRCRACAHGL